MIGPSGHLNGNDPRSAGTNACYRHHAAGYAFFGAMAEEGFGMAGGAGSGGVDVFCWDARGLQLPAVGLAQIEK